MKFGLAQINTEAGDIDGNVAKMKEYIDKAVAAECDIVVFPELTIPGYLPLDLIFDDNFHEKNLDAIEDIKDYLKNKGILAIFGYLGQGFNRLQRSYYNSAMAYYHKSDDDWLSFQKDKTLLPEYDIFYEKRYFDAKPKMPLYCDADLHKNGQWHGVRREVLSFKGKTFGLFICEDLWGHLVPEYVTDIGEYGIEMDYLISINASPFTINKLQQRGEILLNRAKEIHCPIIYVNRVGTMDGYDGEIVFDGNSCVTDRRENGGGGLNGFAKAKSFEEDFVAYDSEEEEARKFIYPDWNSYAPDQKIHLMHDALVHGIREYAKRTGFKEVLVSVSGGIDSAVVLALAVEAMGVENVHAVTLPSHVTSEDTHKDSFEIARNLGMAMQSKPIGKTFETMTVGANLKDLTLQNIQARIRGNYIMALSNENNWLVLSTGNKTELALGYCTLYGDMAGGLAVIGDVDKPDVYNLARYINEKAGGEIIPQATIDRAPSAELTNGQTDEESLGASYDVLAKLVNRIVEHMTPKATLYNEYDKELVDKIYRMIKIAEYKRRQAPPAIKVSDKAFGIGRRIPIGYKYEHE